MNWKLIFWFIIFPPAGLYVLLKNKDLKVDPNLDTKKTDKNNTEKVAKTSLFVSVAKILIALAPLAFLLNFFAPIREDEQLKQDMIFLYLFFVVPFFLYPQHQKKLITAALILGVLVVLAESGITSDQLESWWIKIPILFIGVVSYFLLISLLAKKASDPRIKKLASDHALKKTDIKYLVVTGGAISVGVLIYLLS